MSSVQDYKLIYKKWYFWIPLIFMGIAFYTWIQVLLWDLGQDRGYVSYLMLIFLIANVYCLFLCYVFINKVVHRICGILMIVLMVFLYQFVKEVLLDFSPYTFLLNLLSGFILIGISFIKINPNQADKNEMQSETENQSKSIQSDYELISQKWYFWIPLVVTLIASIPWMTTLVLISDGHEKFLINTLIAILLLYSALLAGVYMFISRRVHIICGILMIVLSIGLVGIGNIPIMADSKMMWLAYHSISMLLNFISGVLLVVFSLFFDSKR